MRTIAVVLLAVAATGCSILTPRGYERIHTISNQLAPGTLINSDDQIVAVLNGPIVDEAEAVLENRVTKSELGGLIDATLKDIGLTAKINAQAESVKRVGFSGSEVHWIEADAGSASLMNLQPAARNRFVKSDLRLVTEVVGAKSLEYESNQVIGAGAKAEIQELADELGASFTVQWAGDTSFKYVGDQPVWTGYKCIPVGQLLSSDNLDTYVLRISRIERQNGTAWGDTYTIYFRVRWVITAAGLSLKYEASNIEVPGGATGATTGPVFSRRLHVPGDVGEFEIGIEISASTSPFGPSNEGTRVYESDVSLVTSDLGTKVANFTKDPELRHSTVTWALEQEPQQ